ncbi:MAG: uracil-DNA glycosylase [Thermoleophilia bacterium]|nr:uracil-DNA glycosylase [Thermoleophilia bacterium]
MTANTPPSRGSERVRALRPAPSAPEPPDDIQDAYLKRAITELGELNDEISGAGAHSGGADLPVMSSGSPQADIMLLKWSAAAAERQEGVAFFGRSGTAVLKSVQRLGIDPLTLYGALCVKLDPPGFRPDWVSREIQIVMPTLIVPMGEPTLEALGTMDHPGAGPLEPRAGEVQRWTPTIDVIWVPDIDASLDAQDAKRAFWSAFRAVGEWHQAQPPF